MSQGATRFVAILVSVAVATGGLFATAEPANAATAIVVGTTADGDASNACTTASVTLSSPVTLRNALCVADNLGGAQTVQVPSGTYTLSGGPLVVGRNAGVTIMVQAAPGAAPKIVGDGQHGVFVLDPALVGGVTVTLDGLTVSGGVDNVYGGGGVIGGSGGSSRADVLVVSNSTFSGNAANTVGTSTNSPGGAIQFIGGSLAVTNSTFTGNSAGSSQGGAIVYQAEPGVLGQGLTISGSTFRNNTTTTASAVGNGGGALSIADRAGTTPMSITSSTFDGNQANGSTGMPARGGAIWLQSGSLGVTGSTFTGNVASGPGAGASAIEVDGGALTAQYNRFSGNAGTALAVVAPATANATENWWGCASGPGNAGCDRVTGTSTGACSPYLTLTAAAAPALILPASPTATVTASLLIDSAGAAVSAANLKAFDGLPITWSALKPYGTSVAPASTGLTNGSISTVFSAPSWTFGAGSVTANLDAAAVVVPIGIGSLPMISSPSLAAAVVGRPGTFTVRSWGYPLPALSLASGTMPSGLTLVDNGDGTATLSGAPAAGTAGDYALVLRTANIIGTTTQALTLQVQQLPAITSAATATFAVGGAGAFTVTTTGRPTPTPLTVAGTLPAGVTFTDNGNGTASLSGTPSAGAGGAYPLTITAANGVAPAAVQSFTLTVNEAPRFTSAGSMSASYQQAGSFTVTTAPGFPAATMLTLTGGSLPTGLTFTDNGDGTAAIAGISTVSGAFSVTLTATNSLGLTTTQALTIEVDRVPQITLPVADQKVNAGNPASFTAGAVGFPAPTVHWEVSADSGATWTTIGGATSPTLTSTGHLADDGNIYRAVFTNSSGSASSDGVLTVGSSPTISSAAAATFSAGGGAQTFDVTTSAFPNATLSTSGALPSWLTFTDNGDGTATLAGSPPVAAGGQYPFTIVAANSFNPDATQAFTLTVTQAPTFTSASTVTVQTGVAGGFVVSTTAGFPAATTIANSGVLPSGLSFTDNGDGTATVSGTPAVGSGGVYVVPLTASTGSSSSTTQSLIITVIEAATFTSPATVAVTRGVDVDFTVTTGFAYPAVGGVTLTGALPAGLALTDNHDGSATISGHTVAAAGASTVQLTAAAPGVPDLVQTLTLVVTDARTVLMPLLPTASGPVDGVPSAPTAGERLTLTADGFAEDAPITFAIYSTPVVLAVANADASGNATATVIIPAGYTGSHSLVASGIAPDGSERFRRTDIVLPAATGTGTGTGTGTATGSGATSGTGTSATTGVGSTTGDRTSASNGTGLSTSESTGASSGTGASATSGTDPVSGSGASPEPNVATSAPEAAAGPGSSSQGRHPAGTGFDAFGLVALATLLLAAGAVIVLRRLRRPERD